MLVFIAGHGFNDGPNFTGHAGNACNQRLGNAAYHANIIAYTAARFDQVSLDDPSLGHGLFTYAVMEALDGKD
jgi:uncharacterized caspase-like protein